MKLLSEIKRILFEEDSSEDEIQGIIDAEEAIAQLFIDSENILDHEVIQDFLDDEQNKEAAGGEQNLEDAWNLLVDEEIVKREGNTWIWDPLMDEPIDQKLVNIAIANEENLQEVPLRKINKIRGGKVIRKAFTAGKKGFRAVRKAGGKTARVVIQRGSEKLKRKLGAIKSAKARRAKKSIIKRKTAISKKRGKRVFGKSARSFSG